MGLMNVGRTEGTEIIQLFGRGIRLKGYKYSLKRHTALCKDTKEIEDNSRLEELEKLDIFDIHSDYMSKFKEYLEADGVPVEERLKIHILVKTKLPKKELKIIGIKDGLHYRKSGEKPHLERKDFIKNPEVFDYYPSSFIL